MKLIVDDNSKQHVRCFFHMLRVRQLRRFVDDNVIHTLWFELWYSHGWTTVIVDAICLLYIKSTPAAMSARCSRQACCVMHHHVLTLVLFCSSFTVCLSPVVFNKTMCAYVLMFDIYPRYCTILHAGTLQAFDSRLRSTAHGDFIVPMTPLRFADRSFTVAGPKAWNALRSGFTQCNLQRYFLNI